MSTYPWEGLPTQDAGTLLNERNPREYPWGIRLATGCAPACPPDIFLWSASPEEILEATARLVPRIDGTIDEAAARAVENELLELFVPADRAPANLSSLRDPADAVLRKAYADIVWWGSLNELQASSSPFAHEMVQAFREEAEVAGESTESAIQPVDGDELDDFIEFPVSYGV